MYNFSKSYPYPYWINIPMYNMYSYLLWVNANIHDQTKDLYKIEIIKRSPLSNQTYPC